MAVFQPVFMRNRGSELNALSRIPKYPKKVSPDVFSAEMDRPRNMMSQNVMFEDGNSLKTDLKIQSEEISPWPRKPAASKNLIVE